MSYAPNCGLIAALLCCLTSAVRANDTVHDLAAQQDHQLIGKVELLRDTSWSLTLPGVLNHPGFQPAAGHNFTLKRGATYWVRFGLRNDSSQPLRRFLRLSANDFRDTKLYLLPTMGIADGTSPPVSPTSDYRLDVSVFPIDLAPGETKTVLLYLDRRYLQVTTEIQVLSTAGMLDAERYSGFSGGFYNGAALLYLLLAALLLVLFRNRESWYYLIYSFGSFLYVIYSRGTPLRRWMEGFGADYLFDTLPYISVTLSAIGQLGMFALIFGLRRRGFNGLVRTIITASTLLLPALLTWPVWVVWHPEFYYWLVLAAAACSVSSVFLILLGGPLFYQRSRKREEAIFLLAFLPIVLLVILLWLMETGTLARSTFIYHNAPGLIIFYESFMLGALLIYRAISERLRLRQALENDRLEIVHDLHSGLMPEIDALVELNQRLIRPKLPEAAGRIRQLGEELAEDLRSLMWTMTRKHGGTLDELVARLRQKVASRFVDSATTATFVTEPLVLPENIPLPFMVSYHLFHFVKEATNNAAKHARAAVFVCRLKYSASGLLLVISDDGRGFTPFPAGENSGHGLRELQMRADKLGGILLYKSQEGGGTRITLTLLPGALRVG